MYHEYLLTKFIRSHQADLIREGARHRGQREGEGRRESRGRRESQGWRGEWAERRSRRRAGA